MVKTRNGNNYGTKQANSSDTNINADCNDNHNHNHNNDNNNNNKKRKSKKDKKRVIEIEFFNSDGFGACKYCTYCPRCKTNKNKIYFNKIEDWRDHYESCHYNDCGYECPECDRNSQNWYNYTNHVQTHDSIPPAWNCIIDGCNLPFANIYSLLSHWKKNHTQYIIRKIPSRSTVADDLRILMGTYDLSGGEDKDKDKDDQPQRKKRGNHTTSGRAPKRRKLNNNSYKTRRKAKRKHSDSDTSSDFIISSDSDIVSSSDEYTSNDTMNSINILNEIMKDIKPKPKPKQKPKKPLNHLNGIELLLKAVEMMGNKEKKKVDKDKENTNKKPLFNVEPIKPSNPLENNSLVLPQQNHLFEPKQSSFQAKLPSLGPSFESSNTNILSLPNIVANPATAYATNINMIHEKQSQQIQHIPLNTPVTSQHILYNNNNNHNINRPLLLQPQQQQQQQPQLHYNHMNTLNNMSIIQNRYNRHQPRAQQLFISNQHQLTTYQQPTYQTFQVPLSHINHANHVNHFNHVNGLNGHGINQQFAVVQSPNRSMMAVKMPLVLQQKVQQIPLQQMQTMQPTVLHLHDFNQHNNNHRIHNINNISTNINNITHINNGTSIIKNNQSTNSNNTPTTQSQSQSLSDNNSNHHDDIPELVDVPEFVTSNTNKLHLPVLPILSLPTFSQKK